jgi:predicted transcriptional regulator
MARRKENILTELEMHVMSVVWERGEATVRQVMESLTKKRPLAYTTVMTVMGILEKKRFLKHRAAGRAYVYSPTVKREKVIASAFRRMAKTLFDGSPEKVLVAAIENEKLSSEQLSRLKELIEQKEKETGR